MGDCREAGTYRPWDPAWQTAETMQHLREVLAGQRFRMQREEDLQEGIARAIESAGIPFEREAILSKWDRVDFLVGGVALEVKVAGSLRNVVCQLLRYAKCPRVQGILLVTTRSQVAIPAGLVEGKPIECLTVFRGLQ